MVLSPSLAIGKSVSSALRKNFPVDVLARANRQYDDYFRDDNRNSQQYDDYYVDENKQRYIPKRIASMMEILRNHKQLGASLVGIGFMLTFAGMMLFFQPTLLRLGNICLIVGIPLLVGPDSVRKFFMKRSRTQASIIIAVGIFLVMWGKPRFGIILELFGLLNVFGNMNPLVIAIIKKLPIIGDMITAFQGKDRDEESDNPKARSARVSKQHRNSFF